MILYDQSATASTNPQGLIQKAWVAYKGNTSWPTPTSDKYLMMVMIANRLKNEWALDSKVHWDSLFTTRTYGPITSANQAYALDDDVFYLSDFVYILRTDGNTDRFQVVHPESRNNNSATAIGSMADQTGDPLVYLTGSSQGGESNLTLNWIDSFATDLTQEVGGTIQVGCYALPDDMVNASDTVPINNPEWAVMALAAELARNDPAKQDQYPLLIGQANDQYSKMVLDNQGNSFQQPNGPMYAQQQLGVTWVQA